MIEVKNVEKSYGTEKVLKGISLTVGDGDFISVMGKSGSGKSTLLNILGGFLPPDSGKVLWDNEDISTLKDEKMAQLRCTRVGFVFQSFRLIPTLNVKDNLLLPAILGKNATNELRGYTMDLADELGLSGMLGKLPEELSGGQCQRAAIVRALSYKPSVIILDEPTGALDCAMERTVMELLRRTNEQLGTSIIQVTHSKAVAEYAKRIIMLKDGEITDEPVF